MTASIHPSPSRPAAVLRARGGHELDVEAQRWIDEVRDEDARVLARAAGPVLDVGCGPGRHVAWLHQSGVPALGIDVSPQAVVRARARGARARHRCVFSPILGGLWRTVLLLDGNVGIGGDPVKLLRRCEGLLHVDGRVLAELAAPGTPVVRSEARLELDGHAGPWFALASLPADHVAGAADAAGLRPTAVWEDAGRWFAELERRRDT